MDFRLLSHSLRQEQLFRFRSSCRRRRVPELEQLLASYSEAGNDGFVGGIGLSALILPEWQHSED
jgi:hypothetical protein